MSVDAEHLSEPRYDSFGRLVGGVLRGDLVVDAIPCKGRRPIALWTPGGELREAELALALELGGVVVPAGSRLELWELRGHVQTAWLATDSVIAGVRLAAGDELSFTEAGELSMAYLAAGRVLEGRSVAGGSCLYWEAGAWLHEIDDER